MVGDGRCRRRAGGAARDAAGGGSPGRRGRRARGARPRRGRRPGQPGGSGAGARRGAGAAADGRGTAPPLRRGGCRAGEGERGAGQAAPRARAGRPWCSPQLLSVRSNRSRSESTSGRGGRNCSAGRAIDHAVGVDRDDRPGAPPGRGAELRCAAATCGIVGRPATFRHLRTGAAPPGPRLVRPMTDAAATPAPATAGASAWVTVDAGAIRDNVAELARRAGPAQVHGRRQGRRLRARPRHQPPGPPSPGAPPGSVSPSSRRPSRCAPPGSARPSSPGSTRRRATSARPRRPASTSPSAAPGACESVVDTARRTGRTVRVQAKVDTGLARGGVLTDWTEFCSALVRAASEGAIEVTGTWSHFAWADAPQHPTVRAQQERFVEAVAELERAGLDPGMRHLANSAATLTNPSAHFDLVRPGLAVYGLSPVPDLGAPADFGLREAMRVTARLTQVKRARAGQGVSYGHEYTTERDTVLGLVPMGYADGIPRHAGNAGPGAGARPPPHRRRPGLHGPVRARPRPRLRRCARRRGRPSSAAAPTASPPPRTGRRPPAPSTTRSSPGWRRACPRVVVGGEA